MSSSKAEKHNLSTRLKNSVIIRKMSMFNMLLSFNNSKDLRLTTRVDGLISA